MHLKTVENAHELRTRLKYALKTRLSRMQKTFFTHAKNVFHAWKALGKHVFTRGIRVKNERYGFKNLVVPRSSFKTLVSFSTFIKKRRFKQIVFNAYSTSIPRVFHPFATVFKRVFHALKTLFNNN